MNKLKKTLMVILSFITATTFAMSPIYADEESATNPNTTVTLSSGITGSLGGISHMSGIGVKN